MIAYFDNNSTQKEHIKKSTAELIYEQMEEKTRPEIIEKFKKKPYYMEAKHGRK